MSSYALCIFIAIAVMVMIVVSASIPIGIMFMLKCSLNANGNAAIPAVVGMVTSSSLLPSQYGIAANGSPASIMVTTMNANVLFSSSCCCFLMSLLSLFLSCLRSCSSYPYFFLIPCNLQNFRGRL